MDESGRESVNTTNAAALTKGFSLEKKGNALCNHPAKLARII